MSLRQPMTVKELISKLMEYPDDYEVLVEGRYQEYFPPIDPSYVRIGKIVRQYTDEYEPLEIAEELMG